MKKPDYAYMAELVTAAKANDKNAFAELYALTYNDIYNYCCHYLRDPVLAQDAVQETYILALRKIGSLQDPTLFLAWLGQINFHTCYDIRRKYDDRYAYADLTKMDFLIRDNREYVNPEASAETADLNSRIQQKIAQLPAIPQQIIILRYYNDMTLREIADLLRISVSTVKRSLAQAQKELREGLE